MVKDWDGEPDGNLGKCLANTNASAAEEGRKSKRISLPTIWSLEPITLGIESLRHKLLGLSPLLWIVV